METICQSVSVDPRRTTADSMVGRVVAFVLLTRAIGSVLVVLPREKSVVVQVSDAGMTSPRRARAAGV